MCCRMDVSCACSTVPEGSEELRSNLERWVAGDVVEVAWTWLGVRRHWNDRLCHARRRPTQKLTDGTAQLPSSRTLAYPLSHGPISLHYI